MKFIGHLLHCASGLQDDRVQRVWTTTICNLWTAKICLQLLNIVHKKVALLNEATFFSSLNVKDPEIWPLPFYVWHHTEAKQIFQLAMTFAWKESCHRDVHLLSSVRISSINGGITDWPIGNWLDFGDLPLSMVDHIWIILSINWYHCLLFTF